MRNDINKLTKKKTGKKEIQIIWSRNRPRPLLFKNCDQLFPSLAKRVAPVSLYQNIDTTKCLRNQLGVLRSVTICHLHDGVILLLRPESFSVLLSCAT